MAKPKDVSTGLLFLSIILALFVAFNGQEDKVILSMLAYAVMAAILIMLIRGQGLKEFVLVGDKITPDVLIGAAVGAGFIFLHQINSAISLGAPQALIALGNVGLFVAIVLVAPIAEEFFFRGTVQPWLYNSFGKNNMVSILITSAGFAIYHFTVYGGFLGLTETNTGLFVGAFIFGIAAGFLVKNVPATRNLTTLERSIVAHMIFNAWLLNEAIQFIQIG